MLSQRFAAICGFVFAASTGMLGQVLVTDMEHFEKLGHHAIEPRGKRFLMWSLAVFLCLATVSWLLFTFGWLLLTIWQALPIGQFPSRS